MNFLQGFFKPNIEKLQFKRDVQGLIMTLQYREPAVRRAAVEALGKIGDPCAVDSLLNALKDDSQNVRAEAACALGKIGNPRSVEALIKVLDHKDNQLRHKAAEALVRICASSIEPLIAALKDISIGPKVCCEVIGLLGEIGDPRAVEPIMEAFDQKDAFSCLMTAEALRKIGDPRAFEPLIRALDDGDCDVAWRAASALAKIGDRRAVEPLIKALDQGDTFLCLVAAEALGEIGDPRAVEALMALHRGARDHSVRDQADKALKRCGYQGSPVLADELSELKKLLDRSLNARIFVRSAELLGFRVLEEGPLGLPMESHKGRLILAVLGSIHPTDIARVIYSGKGTEHSITLVDDGKRKY